MNKPFQLVSLAAACFLFSNSPGNAQIVKNISFHTGVAVSSQTYTYGFTGGSSTSVKKYHAGLTITAQAEWLDTKHFSIITEAGYIQKGSKDKLMTTSISEPEGDGTYTTFRHRFDYLTFSPVLKYRMNEKNIMPYVFAGPRIDYLLGIYSEMSAMIPAKEWMNKVVYGVNYGVGASCKITNKLGIDLKLQHYYDLSKAMDRAAGPNQVSFQIKNNSFAANVGITYFFASK